MGGGTLNLVAPAMLRNRDAVIEGEEIESDQLISDCVEK